MAKRIAISGLIPIRPLINLDKVGRDTFNAFAASVTDMPKGSKHRLFTILPGCFGLFIIIIYFFFREQYAFIGVLPKLFVQLMVPLQQPIRNCELCCLALGDAVPILVES